ncbi:MAG: class I SAM-dependent methyltransferase [Luteimonas sp.]
MARQLESIFQRGQYPLEVHAGRDIGAGHLRGWGLEYGELYEKRLADDPIFQAALRAARDRGSLLTLHKLANLYLIIRYAMTEDAGDIYEFGSFSGGSAVFMGTVLKQLGRNARVYAFDTFEGMPATDAVRDMHHKGDFTNTGYVQLLSYLRDKDLEHHVETIKGVFDATLPAILARGGKVGLVHVDCDIYEPIKYVVRECLPSLSPATHIVFDDPLHGSCLGAFDAVQELLIRELTLTAEQAYPHLVFRCPPLP